MNRTRKPRDPEGKFALTTLQNPDIDIRPRLTTAQIAARLPLLQKLAARAGVSLDFLSPAEPPAVPENVPGTVPENAAPENAAPQPLATPQQQSEAVAAPLPAPAQPARRPKKRRRIFRGTPGSMAARVPARELTSLERHARKCLICKHPDREEIDQEFLRWQHPGYIASDFGIPEARYIYRHARATGLLELRRMNVRCALEFFIEEANCVVPHADTIVRAVRSYTRINSRGEWNEPPSRVIYSTNNQNVENQLNVALQAPPLPPPAPASGALPPAIDLPATEPDSNHVSAIRNQT